MSPRILTFNCGSSSLKFDLFAAEPGQRMPARQARGTIERIGADAELSLEVGSEKTRQTKRIEDHAEAVTEALGVLRKAGLGEEVSAVGHRLVHGGAKLREPTIVDDAVIEAIEEVSELAPLHNRPALSAIASLKTLMPNVPMVATFDTAFFTDLPEVAARYALPRDVADRFDIRRYGFHGLAHRYMVQRFNQLRPHVDRPRLITLQLGSGCSATASLDSKPVDTSMGFTPLEGLIMGTRSGDIDPSLPLYLARGANLSLDEVESMLNTRSGLLGLSGRSNDMRDLLDAEKGGDKQAALAIEAFCYRIRKYIGAYMAVLGGTNALIFGGGIGEQSPEVRDRVCTGLEWTGLKLNEQANHDSMAADRLISADESAIEAWVVEVDEAVVIVEDVLRALQWEEASPT